MMCQCDCEKPGNEVRNFLIKLESYLGVESLLPFRTWRFLGVNRISFALKFIDFFK